MAGKRRSSCLSCVLALLVPLVLVAAVATPALAQSPAAYWTFDDGSGTRATDSSGNGHPATMVNGVGWVPGEIGGAVSANAAKQQYLSIPPIDLSRTHAVTVTLWTNRTYSTTGGHPLFEATSDYTNSTTGFGLFPDDTTCHGIQVGLRGDVGYSANCYSQPSSGAWHHLAVVFDKSQTGGNQVKFYIDGALQAVNRNLYASTSTNNFGNNPIYLFSRAGTTEFNSGAIDDLRIYKSALTAAQIQQIYKSSKLMTLSVTPGSSSITAGSMQQFTATGTYGDGSKQDLTNSATWISTTPSVATMASGGFVTGVATGSATVRATFAGITGFAGVAVTAPGSSRARELNADVQAPGLAIAYVQGNSATPQTPQTTVSVKFNSAQAAGDLNVVVVGCNDSTAVVGTVTDTKGNRYIRAVGPTVVSGTLSQSIYYAKNIAVATAGANSVTVSFLTAASYPDIRILEYSGADLNNPVDVTAANTGSSAASSSGSATTTNATDLIFGANIVATTTSGPGSGFTSRMITSPDGDIAEDQAVTATGNYSATATVSPSGPWIMQMVAFRTPGSFTIAASPASLGVVQGNQGRSTITTTVSGGFKASIAFSAAGAPTGTIVNFSPATIAAPGAGSSIMTITVGAGTPTGTYPITVTGNGGEIRHTATVTLTVTTAANFTIAASPASLGVVQGNQGRSTLTTTISGGFKASVALSAAGAPTGTTVSFNPATIAAPGSGSSTMTITVGAGTPTGTYPITVTGNGGGIRHTATVTLTVTTAANFTIAASPASLGVVQGNQGRSTLTTTISGGFKASIAFSAAGAPTGTIVNFSPATIAAPGAGSSIMTITVGAGTPTGTYPITVTGNGGGIRHTATVTLTVTPARNFTISASPASLSVLRGNQRSSTLTATIRGGFSASIALSASGAPTGTTVSFNPATIAAPGAGSSIMTVAVGARTPTGIYAITVTGSGGGIVRTVTVSLTVTAQVALSWNASTSQGVVGYNAYRSNTSGGPYTKLNSTLIAATTYTDKTVQSGVRYYYATTAVNSQGLESVYSNEAPATVP